MQTGCSLNADHIWGRLYFYGGKRFQSLQMLDAFPLKERLRMEGYRGRDKTEAGMEQGMWVYMVAVVGAG